MSFVFFCFLLLLEVCFCECPSVFLAPAYLGGGFREGPYVGLFLLVLEVCFCECPEVFVFMFLLV